MKSSSSLGEVGWPPFSACCQGDETCAGADGDEIRAGALDFLPWLCPLLATCMASVHPAIEWACLCLPHPVAERSEITDSSAMPAGLGLGGW